MGTDPHPPQLRRGLSPHPSQGGSPAPMAVLLPTPSVDWDPGSSQRPSQQHLHAGRAAAIAWFPPGPLRGQGKERAVATASSAPSATPPRRTVLWLLSPFPFLSAALGLGPPLPRLHSSPLRPSVLLLRSLLRLARPPLPSPEPSPLIPAHPHLPHPVPPPWCVLVSAPARPGRTDGSLLRPRSPWAPTPPPPPGAAQVSRWKVRGAAGKEGLGFTPGWSAQGSTESRVRLHGSAAGRGSPG